MNKFLLDYYSLEYADYFGKNKVIEYKLENPCKKSEKIAILRKIGDTKNQFVTNVYFLDTLYGDDEIYSTHQEDDEYSPIYSYYHSECEYCQNFIKRVRENLIVGYRIYPVGIKPEHTYKEKKKSWEKYDNL